VGDGVCVAVGGDSAGGVGCGRGCVCSLVVVDGVVDGD